MQLLSQSLAFAATLAIAFAPVALADTPPATTELPTTWECSQADGSLLYTNKEKAGCRPMTLKPLSVVPDLEQMPTIPRTVAAGRQVRVSAVLHDVEGYKHEEIAEMLGVTTGATKAQLHRARMLLREALNR